MRKEVAEAETLIEKLQVTGKWLSISGNQDLLTGKELFNSFKDSMAGAGVDVLSGGVGVLRDPIASIDAMNEFILSVDGEKLFGAAAAGFKSQITQLREALVVGGNANAENLGKQLGEAVALYAQVIATGGTGRSAQGVSALSKAGVEVSISGFNKIVASTKSAGGVEGKLSKLERIGADTDVPNQALVGGSQYVESATIQANTTVRLSESIRLPSGKVVPKGSIVTVSDDAMNIMYPDGASELASYAKVNTPALGLVDGAKGNQLINGKWVDAEGLPLPVPSCVGASGRVPNVLQTGGNTLNKSTANALNEHFGESLALREWGRALEALKADAGKLPNNFHGRILDDGDYVGKGGEVIGNIRDYLP